jgi:BirA family biotin operon repressor/biotin-[acetyl-CoA-carboxylase] ligase
MNQLDPAVLFRVSDSSVLIGRSGEALDSVASTMAVARDRSLDGAPDGYVVVAEYQRQGRGTTGGWHCPCGLGVLMSVVLRPGLPTSDQKLIVILGAVGASEAVRALGVQAGIKWPNDVVVARDLATGLSVRKLGGVLAERVGPDDTAQSYVLGIGINVNQAPADLPAASPVEPTSMRIEGGRNFDRLRLCRALLQRLDAWYRRLRLGQAERLLERWRQLSCLIGRAVVVDLEGRSVQGTVVGLRRTGELIVRPPQGDPIALPYGRAKLRL